MHDNRLIDQDQTPNKCTSSKPVGALRFFLLFILLLIGSTKLWSQGYHFTVSLKNCPDSTLILYRYFGNEEIMEDNGSRIKGQYEFTSTDPFIKGLYKIAWQNNKHYFDLFLVNSIPFKIECDSRNIMETIKFEDSEENKILYDYLAFFKSHLKTQMHNDADDTLCDILEKTDFKDKTILTYTNQLLSKYSSLLSVRFMQAFIVPKPSELSEPGKHRASTLTVQSSMKQFFAHFDFADPRLVSSPAFPSLADNYFDQYVEKNADSIKAATDLLLSLSSKNKESQKAAAWLLAVKFSNYYYLPGYDEAYVHIIENYLKPDKIPWYYPETKDRDIKRAEQLNKLFSGKTAPDMTMPDMNNDPRELNKINANYILLLFWASSCSHCRDDMPKIIAAYKKLHDAHKFEIFAVSTDTSVTRWKNYIMLYKLPWINVFGRKASKGDYFDLYHIQSTPTMFLLDEKKRIIAKYISVNDIEKYINRPEMTDNEY